MKKQTDSQNPRTLQEGMIQMRETLATLATKDDIQKAKREILDVVEPIEKAFDKDALTIINHEKRISRIEKKLILK